MELFYVKSVIIKFTEKNMKIDNELFEKMPKELQDLFELKHNPECPCYMLDKRSGFLHKAGNKKVSDMTKGSSIFGIGQIKVNPQIPGDEGGGASRFFYVAKSSRSERNKGCENFFWLNGKRIPEELYRKLEKENDEHKDDENWVKHNIQQGNIHLTVKSLKLLEYLCLLTKTPTGGIVLDPFAGSGTTCIAAKKTGRDYIGIEKEEEYISIARARLNATEAKIKSNPHCEVAKKRLVQEVLF